MGAQGIALLACGLCFLLAAEAFTPAALPPLALRARTASSVCTLHASAGDNVSRRSVLSGGAAAAVALAAGARPIKVFAEEEEEEEEEEEAPKAKKAPAPAAPKAKGPKKQFQGSDKSGVAAGPSAAALSVKAVGAAAFVGGSAFGFQKYKSKYGNKGNDEAGIGWKWGFTGSAENWNGRFAMMGFAGILVLELVTGQGITTGLGLFE